MYLKDYLKQFGNRKIKLFVDMDGVIADYIFGSAQDYDKKRPLYDSIIKLEEVSKMPNVELFIFSATRYSSGFDQKHWWLDTYAPFFKRENRIIISREENNMTDSSILKAEFLARYERDGSILILIDDDPKNLKDVRKRNDDIILLKDTVLVDDTVLKLNSDIKTIEQINKEILRLRENRQSVKKVSDGYHTFEEYTDMRNRYFMALCEAYYDLSWKSKKHFDEKNDPMFDGDFIAGINTPTGIITQHIKMKYWDELDVREIDNAPQYDGYTEEDVKSRVKSLKRQLN